MLSYKINEVISPVSFTNESLFSCFLIFILKVPSPISLLKIQQIEKAKKVQTDATVESYRKKMPLISYEIPDNCLSFPYATKKENEKKVKEENQNLLCSEVC